MRRLRSVAADVVAESFETDDIGAAERIVQRVYPRADLRESRRAFRFEQLTRAEGGIGFTRFRFESWMDIAVEFERVAAFGLVLGGDYVASSHRDRIDTARPFVFRPGAGGSQSEHLDLLMVNIDLTRLATAAAARLGVEPTRLRFSGTTPVSPALEAHWLRTLRYAWSSVAQDEEVFRNDLIRVATFDAVLAAALTTFPIELVGDPAPSSAAVPSAPVARAKRWIEDHAAEPLTVEEIAEAGRISARALQLGFRSHLGTTPSAYLRDVRLDGVRQALLTAEPGEVRVAEVARSWGFAHLGRFAAAYRDRFGEPPSTTLRR